MKVYLKLGLLLLFIATGFAVWHWTPAAEWFSEQRLASIKSAPWAGLLFVLMYAAASPFVPSLGLSVIGGAVFGFFPGFFFNYAGVIAGAAVSFAISRALGREAVTRMLKGKRLPVKGEILSRHGLRIIAAMRIIPVFPYHVVNYGAALSGIRLRDYVLGTCIGVLPATCVTTYLANAIISEQRSGKAELLMVAAVTAAVLLAWGALPAGLKRLKKKEAEEGHE